MGGVKITAHKNSLSEEAITSYYGAYHGEMGVEAKTEEDEKRERKSKNWKRAKDNRNDEWSS